ncbi:alpha/beta hydrolase [Candidatus Saccharibacteria bacterium]|nr:alpha/beta hydrolase [Candidatus Saccharibacteria bacterium]
MRQIVHIHGGNTFNSYAQYLETLKNDSIRYERLLYTPTWRKWLAQEIDDADVLLPSMPNKQNAQYEEWKIYFEKILPLLCDDVHFVGSSLGAIFLAKYLHENPLSVPVSQLILVAGPYDDETNEDLGNFRLNSTTGLEQSAKEIHLFHSTDDPVVPFSELAKFQRDLPTAKTHIFEDRNHFFQPTFPELKELLEKK